MDAGYRVHLANTWAVKQYDRLKHADDRHGARWLAHLLALGILPEWFIYPKEERGVRDLLRRRLSLVQKKTAFLLAMRGAFECRTGLRTRTNDVKKWTVDVSEPHIDDPYSSLGVSCLLGPIGAMEEPIKLIEKIVLKQGRLREEYRHLTTVWGFGKVLGLTIMYEVGEIDRFAKVGNFASYCRFVKSDLWSNGKRKGTGNVRNGNPYLSWAFSGAAHFATIPYEDAKKYVQEKRAKTNGIVAIRALAHKLARASYHVMKDQVDFDPERTFTWCQRPELEPESVLGKTICLSRPAPVIAPLLGMRVGCEPRGVGTSRRSPLPADLWSLGLSRQSSRDFWGAGWRHGPEIFSQRTPSPLS